MKKILKTAVVTISLLTFIPFKGNAVVGLIAPAPTIAIVGAVLGASCASAHLGWNYKDIKALKIVLTTLGSPCLAPSYVTGQFSSSDKKVGNELSAYLVTIGLAVTLLDDKSSLVYFSELTPDLIKQKNISKAEAEAFNSELEQVNAILTSLQNLPIKMPSDILHYWSDNVVQLSYLTQNVLAKLGEN